MKNFNTAQEAFEHLYTLIESKGSKKSGTTFLKNVGFYILNPLQNSIETPFRKWSKSYAEKEWKWYLSGDQSVEEIKKHAKIWDSMHNGDNIVNSNYGYQWNRNNQLLKVVEKIRLDKFTRQAVVTIYDGKEQKLYSKDTPCTLNIIFDCTDNMLNMTVLMRSNDLWFGFCNDQYCFSELQKEVARMLSMRVGWYYHFSADLHLYDKHLKKNPIEIQSVGNLVKNNL